MSKELKKMPEAELIKDIRGFSESMVKYYQAVTKEYEERKNDSDWQRQTKVAYDLYKAISKNPPAIQDVKRLVHILNEEKDLHGTGWEQLHSWFSSWLEQNDKP